MATTSSASPVVAHFATETQAEQAIQHLQSAGFEAHQIGAAASQWAPEQDNFADTTSGSAPVSGSAHSSHATPGNRTEGTWNKIKNFFEGDSHGGVEQYADENARDTASHEVSNGSGYDYERGDVSHSLTGMSVPEEHSRYFEHRLSSSSTGVLVTVNADGRRDEAVRILEEDGGDLGANASSYDYAETAVPASGRQRIQLLGEALRVHKDRISRGEVRIRKEIVSEQQTVQVPVTHEELVIERVPVNAGTAAEGLIGESSEMRIPLTEERASIDKQTLVREEVAVGKQNIEGVQQLDDSVRHEELRVEDETTTSHR